METKKRIIAIGGGEIRTKETLKIDEYIASLAKERAGENRAYGLFLGTASHDSMPYFNSFRKTYTSVFDIKADVALTVYGEMNIDKIKEKFQKADFVYLGGGDTIYMLKHLKEFGVLDLIFDAYERGVIITGLSAGAICWFKEMFTDSEIDGKMTDYAIAEGLGVLDGIMSPHYDERKDEFDEVLESYPDGTFAYGVENLSAIEFVNGEFTHSVSAGGKSYLIKKIDGKLYKEQI